jgi:glyoxylase-like metal-dependent hydrolase (beta-lactamase superfamily II)
MAAMSAKLQIYTTNDPFYMENGYTVYLREGGACWIIDPGLPPQAELIVKHVQRERLQPAAIVLTHAHPDHIAGVDDVRDELGEMPVYLAREEWSFLTDPHANLSALVGRELRTNVTDPRDLPHGSALELEGTTWSVLDVSGHSPGGRAFYCPEHKVVIAGDALFAGSIGRTDFPSSSGPLLMRNIRENLMSLPDDTRVLSGHGPETTIGREKRTNPFVLG